MTPPIALELIDKAFTEKATFLDLGNCGLTAVPDEITRLAPFLKELNFGNYYFKGSEYSHTANKGAGNDFSGDEINWSILQKLSLTGLYLSQTYLSTNHIGLIAQYLTQLTSLDVSDNQLTDVGAQHIATQLNNLTALGVRWNQLTAVGAQHIATQLNNLTALDIRWNQLTDAGTQQIASQLNNLTALQISNNQLTDVGAQNIASQLNNLTALDISNNQLTDVGAQNIASQLNNLTTLQIANNQLTDVGAQHIATQLNNLTALEISVNQLTDVGVQHIASQLNNLTTLDIRWNQLTAVGAQHIASQLNNLTALEISNNQLTDVGAQHIASQLNNLTALEISYNQLTDVGAQHIASQLNNLTALEISNNQLTDVGAQHIASQLNNLTALEISNNQLTEASIEQLIKLPKLTQISFSGNKIVSIPEAILDNLKALRDYFQAGELVDNNFIKVILVGNTTAGKSSLADYLINGTFKENRKSTHGIQLWKWNTDTKNKANGLIVNIWDFGGQDYYHATHTLFLSEKALFLLLHTDEQAHLRDTNEIGQYLSVGYWLGNIKTLTASDSVTWFIQSKYEPDDNGLPEKKQSQRLFLEPTLADGMIQNQFAFSVKKAHEKDPMALLHFNYFRKSLVAGLRQLAKQQLPASWIVIRDTYLPQWRKTATHLSTNEFWEQCQTAVANTPGFRNDFATFPDGLLAYLNGCGEIVWFRHNSALASQIYLGVAELTRKLFDILSLKIKDNQGIFTLSGISESDRTEVEDYLKLLTEFKLIFKATSTTDTYIIPQYLPENPYTRHFQQLIEVAYVIRFSEYMPRSLVTRFLVQYGNTEGSYYWRYGAFFKRASFHLFVQMDVNAQTATIHISDGPTREKYTILRELFQFFTLPEPRQEPTSQYFSSSIDEKRKPERVSLSVDDKRIIQLSSDGAEFVSIADLEKAIQSKLTKVKSTDGNYISISPVMHQLLTDGATTPKKIFLSYAHKDEAYKKELDTHFSALKRSGLVETWQDREIMAGEDWDKVIKDAIKQSDIVLLMLSPDFMASDYIWHTELPAAKEHNTIIIPLFIRPCDFEETQFNLYKQQGLPGYENARTRWIVSSDFPNRDEGYLKIVEGLKVFLKAP